MPIDRMDPAYQASVRRAKADCIAFRRQHGLNPDPNATTLLVSPTQVQAMETHQVIYWPFTKSTLSAMVLSELHETLDALEELVGVQELEAAIEKRKAARGGVA